MDSCPTTMKMKSRSRHEGDLKYASSIVCETVPLLAGIRVGKRPASLIAQAEHESYSEAI